MLKNWIIQKAHYTFKIMLNLSNGDDGRSTGQFIKYADP